MANGIIIIDKPTDWTSMDICAKLRGILKEKKIGHAGTLDPMATGVLPVFVGNATRAVEFAEKGDKEYIAGLRLGIVTNTQDTSGEVLESRPVSVFTWLNVVCTLPFLISGLNPSTYVEFNFCACLYRKITPIIGCSLAYFSNSSAVVL